MIQTDIREVKVYKLFIFLILFMLEASFWYQNVHNKIFYRVKYGALQIDDKNLKTNNICEKSEQIFKMDDALVCHLPGSVKKVKFWKMTVVDVLILFLRV